MNQYLKKGRSAFIEGRLTTRSWDDKDGNKRYKTEIVANAIQFLGGPGGGNSGGSSEPDMGSQMPSFDAQPMSSGHDSMVEEDLPF